jgi:hypothetical protein
MYAAYGIRSIDIAGGEKLQKVKTWYSNLKCTAFNCTLFWNITPSSPLKVKRDVSEEHIEASLITRFHSGFLFGLYFDPEDGGNMFLRNMLNFNGLHDILSQKMPLSEPQILHKSVTVFSKPVLKMAVVTLI